MTWTEFLPSKTTGDLLPELIDPEFVWDMSNFRGWPEQKLSPGLEGARQFLRDWLEAWDDWELSVESLHDGGDRVVRSCASAAARRRPACRST